MLTLVARMEKYLPILMYHGVASDRESLPPDREIGAEIYDVDLTKFTAQMNWLSEHDYHTVGIDELDSSSQQKQVILTFDDGEMNNFIHALPVMQKLGLKAYFFVITERVGTVGYLGWDELQQMQEAGMMIGSHSVTHRILTSLTDDEIEIELNLSRKHLTERLGDKINTLSIPRGFYNDKVIKAADKIGYQNIFVSEPNGILKSHCWSRVAVKGGWEIPRFEQAIEGIQPVKEQILDRVKQIVKKPLNGAVYNRMRDLMVGISH